ncbi:hypothetical protein ACE6H2_005887 [Prunus campanulata]
MEIAVCDFNQRLDKDVLTKASFEGMVEELQGQFQEALNSMLDTIKLDVQTKLDHFIAELTALSNEVKDVKGNWALCPEAVLNKARILKEPKVLYTFKSKSFNGKREANELDIFLWNIERYFIRGKMTSLKFLQRRCFSLTMLSCGGIIDLWRSTKVRLNLRLWMNLRSTLC